MRVRLYVTVIGVLLAVAPGLAQDFTQVYWSPFPGTVGALATAGDLLFVAVNDDIGGRDFLVSMLHGGTDGSYNEVGGNIRDIAVNGEYVYVVTAVGFEIWTNGLETDRVKDSNVVTDLTAVSVTGGTAFFAAGTTIDVYDVSTPASPAFLGSVTAAGVQDLAVQGGFIYAACGVNGLQIFQVTADNPIARGVAPLAGSANDVAVLGSAAFVATGGGSGERRLVRVNVVDPDTPVVPDSVELIGDQSSQPMQVRLDGNYAFVSAYGGGAGVLYAVDCSDPGVLSLVTSVEQAGAGGLDVANNLVFVSDSSDNTVRTYSGAGLADLPQATVVTQAVWALIGIPVTLTDPADGRPEFLFGDDIPEDYGDPWWRMSRWNEARGAYDRFGEPFEPDLIAPGLGYLFIQDVVPQATIDIQPEQYDAAPYDEVTLPGEFEAGTSDDPSQVMLANPFNRTYNVADMTFGANRLSWQQAVIDEGLNAQVHTWTGSDYQATLPGETYLWPWQGFWLNRSGGTGAIDVNFPYVAAANSGSSMTMPANWRLDLAVQTADSVSSVYRDPNNGLGGCEASVAGYDPYDAFELTPPTSAFVSLYFTADGQKLMFDNRELEVSALREYAFEVWTWNLPNREFVLTWPNLSELDADLEFRLLDADGSLLADLRETDHFTFTSGSDPIESITNFAITVERSPS